MYRWLNFGGYQFSWFMRIKSTKIKYLEKRFSVWIMKEKAITTNFEPHECVIFSSPEPKAQVSYCHRAPSVVRPSVVVRKLFTFSTSAWWILMKLGRDEVLMVPYKFCCFWARSAQGRIQGGAKIGHGGSPSLRNFFFRLEGYSNKPDA